MPKRLPYTDEVNEGWTDEAMSTVSVALSPDEDDPVVLELSGTCPRCRDKITDEHWLIKISGVNAVDRRDAQRAVQSLRTQGILTQPLLPAEFTVQCTCEATHPDPLGRAKLKGCGAAWVMRVEREP